MEPRSLSTTGFPVPPCPLNDAKFDPPSVNRREPPFLDQDDDAFRRLLAS